MKNQDFEKLKKLADEIRQRDKESFASRVSELYAAASGCAEAITSQPIFTKLKKRMKVLSPDEIERLSERKRERERKRYNRIVQAYCDYAQTKGFPFDQESWEREILLPELSQDGMKRYLELWKKLSSYREQEKALDYLFHNVKAKDEEERRKLTLVKVATLNDFYSTNIFDVFTVANHILQVTDVESRLGKGDLSLVDEIRKVRIDGKDHDFYSFATKYCSHHNDKAFPIFDYYVEKILNEYRREYGNVYRREYGCLGDLLKEVGFKSAKDLRRPRGNEDECSGYEIFKKALEQLAKWFGLGLDEDLRLKNLDRYLWQLGKDLFPRSYSKKAK